MPSINKTSVRDELDRLKAEFHQQSDDAMPKENRLLIQSLFTLFDLIVAIFLEKQTKKTDKNSSKPSSQTEKDESSTAHKGSKKKGKDEQNESAYNSRTRETTTISEVNFCDVCGEDLTEAPCLKHVR